MKYKIGDKVLAFVKKATSIHRKNIVSCFEDVEYLNIDELKTSGNYNQIELLIIGIDAREKNTEYLLLIDDSSDVYGWTLGDLEYYNVDKKYLNCKVWLVNEEVLESPLSVSILGGIEAERKCKTCSDWYLNVAINQKDGVSFACYRCRHDPRNGLDK